jgi:hypothetical protein
MASKELGKPLNIRLAIIGLGKGWPKSFKYNVELCI